MPNTTLLLAAALLVPVWAVSAQERPEGAVYKAEFNIHDGTDAAAKTGRRYSMLLNPMSKGVLKVGNRVPAATASMPAGNIPGVSTQYTYIDVGVNIDLDIREQNGRLNLRASMDISTIAPPDKNAVSVAHNPTISQIKLNIDTGVTAGKPVVVAAFDDPVTGQRFEVQATITKM
jgi:hypothetical protein